MRERCHSISCLYRHGGRRLDARQAVALHHHIAAGAQRKRREQEEKREREWFEGLDGNHLRGFIFEPRLNRLKSDPANETFANGLSESIAIKTASKG